MSVYRVLVAHSGCRVGQVLEIPDAEPLVRAGYLREVEAVADVAGTAEPTGLDAVAADLLGDPAPRPRRGRPKRPAPSPADQEDVRGLDVEPGDSVSDDGSSGGEG